jgi:2'-5' RNA ligase
VPRLFVAVWPPPDVLEQVAALPRPTIVGLRWTRPDQWHVTLRFLGQVEDAGQVAGAVAGAAGGAVGAGGVEAVLGPAVGRFAHRILHVPVAGLEDLAARVVAATAHLGEPPEDRPFAGHLTLARVARGERIDLRHLAGQPIAARWPVAELALVQSHLSPRGAPYEVVDRFPLA